MTVRKILLGVFLLALIFPSHAFAKRVIPRAAAKLGGGAPKAAATAGTKGVTTKVSFRGDRRAIIATFTNLGIASSVSYTLTYESNGVPQGVGGSIMSGSPEPVVRELLFGSCSSGVCRYDKNIKNARLIVTTTLTNGRKVAKTFRIKI